MAANQKPAKSKLPENVAEHYSLATDKPVIVIPSGRFKRTFNFNIITLKEANDLVKVTGNKYLKKKKTESTK